MLKRIVLSPYKMGSASAKALKEALNEVGIKCFRKLPTTEGPKQKTLTVYYGGTEVFPDGGVQLNRQRDQAQNKLSAFNAFRTAEISHVPWTTDPEEARQWNLVVCRQTLTGHSGQGIVLWEKGDTPLPAAKLYTQYVKKQMECRLHVFNGKVIDAQVKRKKTDLPEGTVVDTKIRNVHTGWVYCREGFTPDDQCKQLALAAVTAVGLDFGAVDIIYNGHQNKYYVLEVNTAPGLEGTTLTNYVKEIVSVYQSN